MCARCGGLSYAVVDMVTTGLTPADDAAIEVAVVLAGAQGEAEADWHSLVRPWRPVGATEIHGLREGDLDGAPAFGTVAGRLDGPLDGRVLVVHNAGFDAAMLARGWQRLGQARGWMTACTGEAAEELGCAVGGCPS
nr:exonuclease domain-containing protein [Blastococcus saxobsidens]